MSFSFECINACVCVCVWGKEKEGSWVPPNNTTCEHNIDSCLQKMFTAISRNNAVSFCFHYIVCCVAVHSALTNANESNALPTGSCLKRPICPCESWQVFQHWIQSSFFFCRSKLCRTMILMPLFYSVSYQDIITLTFHPRPIRYILPDSVMTCTH